MSENQDYGRSSWDLVMQEMLSTALERKCVLVGVHKSLTAYPALPFFALIPFKASPDDPEISFLPLTFECPGWGRDTHCENLLNTQPLCKITGVLSGEQFVPHSVAHCFEEPNGDQEPPPCDHLQVTTVDDHGLFEPAEDTIRLNLPRSSYNRHFSSSYDSMTAHGNSPAANSEHPQTKYDIPFKRRVTTAYAVRLPGGKFRTLCKRMKDGTIRVEEEPWTPFDPKSAADKFLNECRLANERRGHRLRSRAAIGSPTQRYDSHQPIQEQPDEKTSTALPDHANGGAVSPCGHRSEALPDIPESWFYLPPISIWRLVRVGLRLSLALSTTLFLPAGNTLPFLPRPSDAGTVS